MTRDVGGEHRFEIGQEVHGKFGFARVIALTVEPSATIEFSNGSRLTVGQSALEAVDYPGGTE
jgi:hypothetical protein